MPETTILELQLRNVAALLRQYGESQWSEYFTILADEAVHEPEQTTAKVRALYGGMGSFNDLVLHAPNGLPHIEANDELERLRSELYTTCRN